MNTTNTNNNASYNFEAPAIADDAGRKVETVFPTAETVVIDCTGLTEAEAPVRRQTTVVKLENTGEPIALNLVPEPANLNVGALVAVSFAGATTVAVRVDGGKFVTLRGNEDVVTTALLLWDGEGFLAVG